MLPPDLKEFLPLFIETARGRISALNNSLVGLEKNPDDPKEIENIFQNAHSLKGEAAMMQFTKLSHLMHVIEDVFYEIKKKHLELNENLATELFSALDLIRDSVETIAKTENEKNTDAEAEKIKKLTGVQTVGTGKSAHAAERRVKPFLERVIEPVNYLNVPIASLDMILNAVEELLVTKLRLDLVLKEKQFEKIGEMSRDWGRLIAELRFHVLKARLIPLNTVFERFPRMIRDLATSEGKKIDFNIKGGEVPLDRTVIDHIAEPLIHILRNAVDHGIEPPEVRKSKGKPEAGRIELKAERQRAFVIITVRDDGAGLDKEKILKKAVSEGLISQKDAKEADDQEIFSLIFQGISTSEKVTEVAGRGVGMSVVLRAVESVGGSVKINTEAGKYTEFVLRIPSTLAIIKALLVSVGEHVFAIPVSVIDRSVKITGRDLKSVGGINSFVLGKEDIPLIELAGLFNIEEKSELLHAVVVSIGSERVGLGVGRLIKEEEIVAKTLPDRLKGNRLFSGITILGTGQPALILDVLGILDFSKKKLKRAL